MDKRLIQILSLVAVLFVIGCNDKPKEVKKGKKKKPFVLAKMPEVNADSVFSFVQKQVDFGPRTPNSEAHEKCADWLVAKLKGYNFEVKAQKGVQLAYDGEKLKFTNIIGRFNPEVKKRILLTAHWDTRPWADQDHRNIGDPIDGANDAGSGVAVILEIARLLNLQKPTVGVDVVLFDIEDYGKANGTFCYGSQYWMHRTELTTNTPVFGINLDMVGDPNATFLYEGFSAEYARPVLDKVWKIAEKMGHQNYFVSTLDGQITDDHLYVNRAGIPCIDIIHRSVTTGFADSWHTHDDNISNISKNTLKSVSDVVLQTIYREK